MAKIGWLARPSDDDAWSFFTRPDDIPGWFTKRKQIVYFEVCE